PRPPPVWRAIANVTWACQLGMPSMPTSMSADKSSRHASAETQDCFWCCDRKKPTVGYEMWLSSTSEHQNSQSFRNGPSIDSSDLEARRRSTSAAAGGDPAHASSTVSCASRRENDWYSTGRYAT